MIKGSEIRRADHPIDNLFIDRWSPRAMSGEAIEEADLMVLFEAARWAPSSFNNQPWRILYARRDSEHWPLFFDLLGDAVGATGLLELRQPLGAEFVNLVVLEFLLVAAGADQPDGRALPSPVAPGGEAYVTCDRGVVRLDAYDAEAGAGAVVYALAALKAGAARVEVVHSFLELPDAPDGVPAGPYRPPGVIGMPG